jgi:uncharacterized protein with von Willebrand factor type A (vWA) domain
MRFRYSRWDGTQQIETLLTDDLFDEIADEVLSDGDLRSALRRMMDRGAQFPSGRRMSGLRELLDRLKQRRQQNLSQYNLGGILDDIRERLDSIINQERQAIEDRLRDMRGQEGTEPEQPDSESLPGEAAQGTSSDQGANSPDDGFQEMLERLAN